jgi:hypothetical protein
LPQFFLKNFSKKNPAVLQLVRDEKRQGIPSGEEIPGFLIRAAVRVLAGAGDSVWSEWHTSARCGQPSKAHSSAVPRCVRSRLSASPFESASISIAQW